MHFFIKIDGHVTRFSDSYAPNSIIKLSDYVSLNIIGISAYYHDSACCILQDGILKAAAQEERFSRKKNDPALPKQAFMYCLKAASLSITDIHCIAYYEDPVKKFARQL